MKEGRKYGSSINSEVGSATGVAIVQRIFPTYRKPIFNAIYRALNFSLLHSTNSSGIKQTTAPYSVVIKKWQYGKGDTHLFLHVFGFIRKRRPKVIIHELAVGIISLPLVLLARKIFGYKLILWGHMYNRKEGFDPSKRIGDKYRLWLQKKADAIITYSIAEKQELGEWKVNDAKIFPAPNTLDTNRFLPIRNRLEGLGKEGVKDALGFRHKYNLIFIGRLYKDKWPHQALEVLNSMLKRTELSIALHFIGNGPMMSVLESNAKKYGLAEHVFFHGEIYDEEETGRMLFASDMMIMPGCVGLSVNHAFCFNCPVITFESVDNIPAHGPEIGYIVNEQTGFVVTSRNPEAMADLLLQYFNDEDKQTLFKQNIQKTIEEVCPIERLTTGFTNAVSYVMSN